MAGRVFEGGGSKLKIVSGGGDEVEFEVLPLALLTGFHSEIDSVSFGSGVLDFYLDDGRFAAHEFVDSCVREGVPKAREGYALKL